MIDRSMESQVTMSQKELLVISPDVRRHMKEVTTSKRVVQNTVEALLATAEVQAIGVNKQRSVAGGMVVGVDCLPLWCIDGLVDGKYLVECTLDSRVQLIAMRRAIWTELLRYPQFPLKPTMTYNMVAMDHSRSSTLGALENVLLKFGGMSSSTSRYKWWRMPHSIFYSDNHSLLSPEPRHRIVLWGNS